MKFKISLLFICLVGITNNMFAQVSEKDTTIYMAAEQAPLFPCDTVIEDYNKRAIVAQKQMLSFVYTRIQYPRAAREKRISGTVITQFIVEKDGAISNIKIVRSLGNGCDEEVIRIIQSMPKWEAGLIKNEKVRVQYTLPVKFKIKENNQKISKTPVASIYKSIDELPMFSNDCIGTYYERMDCGEKAFTKYIINNLEYNLDSFYRFEVSCIIEKDGSIRNVQLEGTKKSNLDNALIDLLQASPKWIPAQNKGKIVTTSINFDIIISPELEEKVKMAPVFSFSEKMPFFPCGCKGNYEEKKVCADKYLLKFIYENIEYPVAAREKGTEGTVFLSFVVEKDGSLSNFKLVENIGNGCGEETLRVVKLMNDLEDRWEPGIQRGQPVRVQFNLPIRFRLE